MGRDDVVRWAIAAGLAAGAWLIGELFRRHGLAQLARWSRRTLSDFDELILGAVGPHVPLWFLLLGIAAGVHFGRPQPAIVAGADRMVVAALLLSLTLALASFLTRFVESRAERWPGVLPATTLTRNAIRISVIGLGSLVVLGTLGIAIAPLLTALGVGSLAVALALQPTLSNLFAGFHITLARKIRVGDFVELEDGQQGVVADIGWRSTQIRELSDNLVIVPNAKLAEIIVRNCSLPEPPQATLVEVGVAYGSDLEQVERVTVAVAREVQRTVTGADETFEPFIRYHSFGESSIDFTVILRVKEFTDRYLLTHEFIRRLQRAYSEAGIEIPFPQRVVHVQGVDAGPIARNGARRRSSARSR